MADIKPGQVFVAGATAAAARQLLDAARKAGLNPKLAVRTTEGGFIVPDAIAPGPAKKTARILPVDPPPEPDSPPAPRRRRKKNTEKGT